MEKKIATPSKLSSIDNAMPSIIPSVSSSSVNTQKNTSQQHPFLTALLRGSNKQLSDPANTAGSTPSMSSEEFPSLSATPNANRQPGTPKQSRSQSTTHTTPIISEKYDMSGLSQFLRVLDDANNPLSSWFSLFIQGSTADPVSLHMDIQSDEPLLNSLGSPFSTNVRRDLVFPSSFLSLPVFPYPFQKMAQFSEDTLFYMFYSMPHDLMQESAAQELSNRHWRFHRELKRWLKRAENTSAEKLPNGEKGFFIVFEPDKWIREKQEIALIYDQLDDHSFFNGKSATAFLPQSTLSTNVSTL